MPGQLNSRFFKRRLRKNISGYAFTRIIALVKVKPNQARKFAQAREK